MQPITSLAPFSAKPSPQFCILDSVSYKSGNDAFIDILALRIEDKNDWAEVVDNLKDSSLSKHAFLTVLEWFTFQGISIFKCNHFILHRATDSRHQLWYDPMKLYIKFLPVLGEGVPETKWTLKSQRTLLGSSGAQYAYLEPGGSGVYIASESKFHYVSDTEKPINLQSLSNNSQSTGEGTKLGSNFNVIYFIFRKLIKLTFSDFQARNQNMFGVRRWKK